MVIIHPTGEQIAEAIASGAKMGKLWGSVTRGAGNVTGMLGEIVCRDYLNAVHVGQKVYSHDLELDGKTIDVKSKRCSSAPLPEYAATVLAKDGKLAVKADRLLFTRVMDDYSTVYITGWLTTLQFKRRSTLTPAGTREGGFLHWADSFNCPISRLNKVELLLSASSPQPTARASR